MMTIRKGNAPATDRPSEPIRCVKPRTTWALFEKTSARSIISEAADHAGRRRGRQGTGSGRRAAIVRCWPRRAAAMVLAATKDRKPKGDQRCHEEKTVAKHGSNLSISMTGVSRTAPFRNRAEFFLPKSPRVTAKGDRNVMFAQCSFARVRWLYASSNFSVMDMASEFGLIALS